jgi:DNA-binding protein YbaB
MSMPLQNQVEQAYARLQRQQQAINDIQASLQTAYSTVTSKNRAVAVTVNSKGVVTGIKFPTSAHRSMPGAELGSLLVETIEKARAQALATTVAAFESMLPAGLPMLELLTEDPAAESGGRFNVDQLVAEALRTAGEQVDD